MIATSSVLKILLALILIALAVLVGEFRALRRVVLAISDDLLSLQKQRF